MKKILPLCLSLLVVHASFAQENKSISTEDRNDIHLTDSVIYFDNKPVAYYYKEINESNPHYNIFIISLNRILLVEAQVVKFDAPVAELKPFYFYNLVFKNEKDTFAIYHYGQSFIVELATLLKDYKLLDGNKINKPSLGKFRKVYGGNPSLVSKIREYVTYLNESRYFNEQTIRDRTKPVSIKNDRVIMQDGKRIGMLVSGTNITEGAMTITYRQVKLDNDRISVEPDIKYGQAANKEYIQVLLPTNRVVDASKINILPKDRKSKLYQISVRANKEDRNDELLLNICQLVENYLL